VAGTAPLVRNLAVAALGLATSALDQDEPADAADRA
jgi:hypothetical protein